MSSPNFQALMESRFAVLAEEEMELQKHRAPTGNYNILLRQLYSRVELLLIEIEQSTDDGMEIDPLFEIGIQNKCNILMKNLNLIPIKRPSRWWKWIDLTFRGCGKLQFTHC